MHFVVIGILIGLGIMCAPLALWLLDRLLLVIVVVFVGVLAICMMVAVYQSVPFWMILLGLAGVGVVTYFERPWVNH